MNGLVKNIYLSAAILIVLTGTLLTPQHVLQTTPDLTLTSSGTKNAAVPTAAGPTSSEITLVGQLIPAVNTGLDAGLGGDMNSDPQVVALQPIEYHLYDAKNNQISLSFNNEHLYQAAWEKWINAQADKKNVVAGAAKVPKISANYPKYALYRELWQDWAGRWISVKGVFTQTNTLEVNVFEATTVISESFAVQLPGILSKSAAQNSMSPEHGQQVIFEHCIRIADSNPLPRPGHMGYIGPLWYHLTDNQGKEQELLIFDSGQPNNETRMVLLDGSVTRYFGDLQNKCAQFTGWLFNPPRSDYKPNLIEVQSIQEISPANMSTPLSPTSTPSS